MSTSIIKRLADGRQSLSGLMRMRPKLDAAAANEPPELVEPRVEIAPVAHPPAPTAEIEDDPYEDEAAYDDADWVDDYDAEDASWDAALTSASGHVRSRSAVVRVFYHLLSRQVPYDVLERYVREAAADLAAAPGGKIDYTNGWLAKSAEHLARQLEMAEEYAAEE